MSERCNARAWEQMHYPAFRKDDDRLRCQLKEGHENCHNALGCWCSPGTKWSGDIGDLRISWSSEPSQTPPTTAPTIEDVTEIEEYLVGMTSGCDEDAEKALAAFRRVVAALRGQKKA